MRQRLKIDNIGRKLKVHREQRKLSMRELAAASDVSASLISKIEAGKVSPTVMSLQKLLDALNVDLYEFFLNKEDADASEQIAFRKQSMVASEDEERLWYYAFPKHPDLKAQLTYEECKPNSRTVEKESHKGDIMGYVISGELTLEIIDRGVFKIRAGDAFYVKAGQLHVARNEGQKLLKLVALQLK
ncbi:MAG: helix-turn-helix domain-containing protein [Armatimonadetes bacterium]|nr:helix-turn-helix domain-containing protein [Armatimonadota bacterium]